jgi:hypothetical protein
LGSTEEIPGLSQNSEKQKDEVFRNIKLRYALTRPLGTGSWPSWNRVMKTLRMKMTEATVAIRS